MPFSMKSSQCKILAPLRLEPLKLGEGFLQEHRIPQHRHSRAGQERFQTVLCQTSEIPRDRAERLFIFLF